MYRKICLCRIIADCTKRSRKICIYLKKQMRLGRQKRNGNMEDLVEQAAHEIQNFMRGARG